jgi:predicted Zn-dependent peptidase
LLLCALYHHHPVKKNICGSIKSIGEITPELLYRCHRAFYHPSNMALIVCGDVNAKQVTSIVDRVLPKKGKPHTLERILPKEPPTVAKTRMDCRMQVSKPLFYIGVKDPVMIADPLDRLRRDAAMTLLDEILFSRSGELYSALFEEGVITPSFFSGYSCTDSFAYHCISGEADDPEEVLCRVKDYLAQVIETGIDREVFERCRRVLYSDELRAYDSTEEIANRLLSFVFDDAEMFSYPALLQSVTVEELEELLKSSFREEYFAISIVYPLETEEKEHEDE